MRHAIKTEININATPQKVWEVFTAFDQYPDWNPFIKSLEGDVKVGNTIKAILQDMTFKPVVLNYTKGKEFRWKGKLFFKGLFDGEHYFQLLANEDGSTRFIHGEDFGGMLVRLFKKKLSTDTKMGFEEMNKALKGRVEAGYG